MNCKLKAAAGPDRFALLQVCTSISKTMSNQVFNANPTVYTSSKSHKTKSGLSSKLWIDDVEEEDDESDEVEPIDQDEVFGV